MVGIYCRVSTKGQASDGHSLETPRERGLRHAADIGEQAEVYSEAKSGRSLKNREERARLCREVEDGLIDRVWVIDNDRLGRNADDSAAMLKFLTERGVVLLVDGKEVDPKEQGSLLLFRVQSAVAEHAKPTSVSKSNRGIQRSIDLGTRPTVRLYGYRREFDKDGSVR